MWHRKWTRQIIMAVVASAVAGLIGQGSYAYIDPSQHEAQTILPSGEGLRAQSEAAGFRSAYYDFAAWRGGQAKQARNAAIAGWLGGLHQAGLAEFTVRHLDKGLIYAVRLRTPMEMDQVTALWVAVPDGPDLPSSVLLRARAPMGPKVLELQSCTSRETLDHTRGNLAIEQAERQAITRLTAYLDAPDPMQISVMGGPREACRQFSRMLPSPH